MLHTFMVDATHDIETDNRGPVLLNNLRELMILKDTITVSSAERVLALARESASVLFNESQAEPGSYESLSAEEALRQKYMLGAEMYFLKQAHNLPHTRSEKDQMINERLNELSHQSDILKPLVETAASRENRKFESSPEYQFVQELSSKVQV